MSSLCQNVSCFIRTWLSDTVHLIYHISICPPFILHSTLSSKCGSVPLVAMVNLTMRANKILSKILSVNVWINHITSKCSKSPLDVVRVVALNAVNILAEEKWRSGNEDDSGEGKNSENTVPDCTFLLQEDPSQEGGKDWITGGRVQWEKELKRKKKKHGKSVNVADEFKEDAMHL